MTLELGYTQLLDEIAAETLAWTSATIKCALLDETYVFDAAHDFFNDVSAFEVPATGGSGYTAGGQALTSKTKTYVAPWWVYDADDPIWPGSNIGARYAVFYRFTGVAGTSPLLLCVDAEEVITTVSAPFTVPISADGLFRYGFTPTA